MKDHVWIVVAGDAWNSRDAQTGIEVSDRLVCACNDEETACGLVGELTKRLMAYQKGPTGYKECQPYFNAIVELDPKVTHATLTMDESSYRAEKLRVYIPKL